MKKANIRSSRSLAAGFGYSLLMAVVMLSWGCSNREAEPESSRVIETNTDPDVFVMQNAGDFPLVNAQVRKVGDEVNVNCVISPNVNLSVPVVSLAGGRVVDIKVKLGDYVEKGQTLLVIDSPDLSGALSDYQKFKADEELADKQLARAKLLYDKGAIAMADLETAEDAHAKAVVDLQTSIAHVKVLGGDIGNATPLLPLRAPISGTIVDQQITGGTGVRSLDNQQALFTIANLSRVWVLCDAYQDMLSRIHLGDPAYININGFPQDNYPGKVINISQVLDPTTRSAKVRIDLPNPTGIMRSGMFVTALFKSREPVDRVVVPAGAVVHLHDRDWVFVPLGGNRFRRIPVRLGPEEKDGYDQLLSGLQPGQQVVANALQFSSASEEK